MTVEELRDAVKHKEMTIGAKEVLRKLRAGKVSKIFLASTCSQTVKESVRKFTDVNKFEVVELPIPSSEIALICKKNFQVSVLSY